MTWRAELRRLGGAASTAQLRAAGATARALKQAVDAGELVRVRKGGYASPDAAPTTLAALRSGARLSCVTAARSYGLWGGADARTHLLVPPHAGRSRLTDPGCVRHWASCEDHPELWRVSLADCLRTVLRCADEETAVAVLDTAISSGATSVGELRRMFSDAAIRIQRVVARARPGSDSGVESIIRQRLTARGHVVEQQIAVPGVGRVDARIDGVLYLEVDGFAFHGDRRAFERDRLRDAGFALAGARWLRVAARHVIDTPDAVVATIEAVLRTEESRGRHAG